MLGLADKIIYLNIFCKIPLQYIIISNVDIIAKWVVARISFILQKIYNIYVA